MPVPLLSLAPRSGRQRQPPVKHCWKTKRRGQPRAGRGTWGLDSWYVGSHPCATEQEQAPR